MIRRWGGKRGQGRRGAERQQDMSLSMKIMKVEGICLKKNIIPETHTNSSIVKNMGYFLTYLCLYLILNLNLYLHLNLNLIFDYEAESESESESLSKSEYEYESASASASAFASASACASESEYESESECQTCCQTEMIMLELQGRAESDRKKGNQSFHIKIGKAL